MKVVEYHPGLYARNAALWINFDNLRHVLRKVEHNGNIAALPSERRAAASAENGHAMFAAGRDGGNYIIIVPWENNANWNLAIVRAIGGVKRTAAAVEPDLAGDMASEMRLKFRVR